MASEKAFYAIMPAIVVIAGIGIGAAYYESVSNVSTTSPAAAQTSLTLIITPNNWFHNSTINHRQPAYFILEPNGTLGSSANIYLPANQLISLTIIDYDSGTSSALGNATGNASNPTQNNSFFAKVFGTVGNKEYIYNGTKIAENATLSGNSSNNISINKGQGWAVSSLPWVGNSTGGYYVTHTFSIISGGKVIVNVPTWAGNNPNGGTVTHAQFYLNQSSGSILSWQCYAPCGTGAAGWGGAMATIGWMMGNIHVM